MLVCPGCTSRLVRAKTPQGIIYLCRKCGGRAVALPLVRKQADASFVKTLRHQAYGSGHRGNRGCPLCTRPMAEVRPTPADDLVLDVCTYCHFVWFDQSEFARMTDQAPPGAVREELPPQAAEAVARFQIASDTRIADTVESFEAGRPGPDHPWKYIPGILGWPVEMEAVPVSRNPWATWLLAAGMVAIFLANWGSDGLGRLIAQWGFIPAQWHRHSGMTILSSFFIHAGWLHLVGNLYFFLVFGDNVEDHLGRGKFLLLRGGAHRGGMLLPAVSAPSPSVPAVGASAGIAGVIAYYGIAFPKAKIGIFFWFFFRWLRLGALWMLVLYALLQLLGAHRQVEGLSNVSYLAHLGGLAAGAVVALLLWRTRPDRAI